MVRVYGKSRLCENGVAGLPMLTRVSALKAEPEVAGRIKAVPRASVASATKRCRHMLLPLLS
jgi:hypothetical protein